ncbi:MAG TPA: hypothetical protein VMD47_05380 [Candidatus Acidoferrales bacterium]|nr:hypothetical protein [Candidatus Acidoferrales bacterium]
MSWFEVIAAALVAITTISHPTVIKAKTRIPCVLETPIDSRTARAGDDFALHVEDPAYPQLSGAVIHGHLTKVSGPHGLIPAEIDFLFDSITFSGGRKELIRAYVISANVTSKTASTPGPVAVPPIPGPAASTIVWQTQLGPKQAQTAQTGGAGYASRTGVPIDVKAGMPVTIQLASDLQTP